MSSQSCREKGEISWEAIPICILRAIFNSLSIRWRDAVVSVYLPDIVLERTLYYRWPVQAFRPHHASLPREPQLPVALTDLSGYIGHFR